MTTASVLTAMRLLPVLAAALLTTLPNTASSATTVSNLGNASGGGLGGLNTYVEPTFGQNAICANAFTTGASSAILNSITLAMQDDFGGGGFEVDLYSDGGTIGPGTLVTILSGPSNPSTLGAYTYAPASPRALTPNTTYFVVAAVPVAEPVARSFTWSGTTDASETSTEGWTIGDSSWLSNDGGASWVQVPFTFAGQFSVDASPPSAAPEPSRALLLAAGLTGVVLRRRRK